MSNNQLGVCEHCKKAVERLEAHADECNAAVECDLCGKSVIRKFLKRHQVLVEDINVQS